MDQKEPSLVISMRARYYNPEIKRFLNEDPFAGKYDDIMNVNLYGYAQGNPVRFVDPSGLMQDEDYFRLNSTDGTSYANNEEGNFKKEVVACIKTIEKGLSLIDYKNQKGRFLLI